MKRYFSVGNKNKKYLLKYYIMTEKLVILQIKVWLCLIGVSKVIKKRFYGNIV